LRRESLEAADDRAQAATPGAAPPAFLHCPSVRQLTPDGTKYGMVISGAEVDDLAAGIVPNTIVAICRLWLEDVDETYRRLADRPSAPRRARA